MKKLTCLLLAAFMIMVSGGCAGPAKSVPADTFAVNVCVAPEPDSMDPALSAEVGSAILIQHTFEGLLRWSDDGDGNAVLIPGMAKSWDVSPDGLTYTFHIRENAKWSDGKPVTAYDFEYGWRRLIDPSTASDQSRLLNCVTNANEITMGQKAPSDLAAEATSDTTFKVTLNMVTPYFTQLVACPALFPVREDIIEKYGDQWASVPADYVSNGPYRMKTWDHNSNLLLVKNKNYYDIKKLGPDSIKFELMDDSSAILSAFKKGELDFCEDYPKTEASSLFESGRLKTASLMETEYLYFRTDRRPFSDARVREAFSLAIDRNDIAGQAVETGRTAAGGYIPSGVYNGTEARPDFRSKGGDYYGITSDDYASNCEKARSLLTEAGYEGGKRFPSVTYAYENDEQGKATAEALRTMWKNELGIEVSLAALDPKASPQSKMNGDYMIASDDRTDEYNDPIPFLEVWTTGSQSNYAHYRNADYDRLIAEARISLDAGQRMQMLHAAEDMLMADSVVAPICFRKQQYLTADDLKGVYYAPQGYFFFGYAHK